MGVVHSIEYSVVAAAALAIVFYRLKQPALLAYIVAGLGLGWFAQWTASASVDVMEEVSHLGLVLLLFIIGLEMDLRGIFRLGARAAAAVLLQGPLTVGAVWVLLWALNAQGIGTSTLLGTHPRAWFFFAAAAGLSSTAVTVKLLADKYELTSSAGQVTVLTLIAQDIWAVLALSYASSFKTGPDHSTSPAWVAVGALVAVLVMGVLSRYVLSRLALLIARSPELVTLGALGWCFTGSAVFVKVGLSAEMGALVAGITLGILPTAAEVRTKVGSLRDFFMALFFVALGISLPPPTWAVLGAALLLVLITIVSRVVLFSPMLISARLGPLVAFTSGINLAQISEFALLLVPVGISSHVLTTEEGSVISYAMMISVLVSSYGIKYNAPIARWLSHWVPVRFRNDRRTEDAAVAPGSETPSILILGYHHNTGALVHRLLETNPEWLRKALVVDTNLKNHDVIRNLGLRVEYGDVSNPETLRHFGLCGATAVLSTVADTYLRGTSNLRLLEMVLSVNSAARFIGTAATIAQKEQLLTHGAAGAVCPAAAAAPAYEELLAQCLTG